jgi:uncharacterized protein
VKCEAPLPGRVLACEREPDEADLAEQVADVEAPMPFDDFARPHAGRGEGLRDARRTADLSAASAVPRPGDGDGALAVPRLLARRYTPNMTAAADRSDLRRLGDVLAAEPDLLLAIVFGSLATGRAGFESDADVAVMAEGPLREKRRAALMRVIAEALGRPVDLLDLRVTGVPLLRSILLEGTTLLCRDQAARARLMSRMLADVEDFLPLRERLLRERRERWIG